MGLRYTAFLLKGSSDALKTAILGVRGISDVTEWMKKSQEWTDKIIDAWDDEKLREKLCNGKEFPPPHPDPKVEAFRRRQKEDDSYYIWWMPFPDTKGIVMGTYSHVPINWLPYLSLFLYVMQKAGIEEVLITEYSHSSDCGECVLVKCQEPIQIKKFEQTKDEYYEYPRFATRVDAETGYPVSACHDYFVSLRGIPPWEVDVEVRIKEMDGYMEGKVDDLTE